MYSSPSPRESSRVLTRTSILFVIPSWYAYNQRLYYYSLILLVNTILSINYWRNPVYGLRRNLDVFFAKFSAGIFLVSGIYYVKEWNVLYNLLLLQLICFYVVGQYLADIKNHSTWYRYHAIFHVYCLVCQFLVLYSIKNTDQLKINVT